MSMICTTHRGIRAGGWALAVSFVCLTLVGCGAQGGVGGVNTTPPQGWSDITPPDSGQSASYVVSPDIPGLMLAAIGGRAQASADPPPAARLWRSRDGGASWQSLDSLDTGSGTRLVMPPGGRGIVFAQNSRDATISVSDDAGTSWRRLPLISTPYSTMSEEWSWLSGAVMIHGRLYAGGVAAGFGGLASGSARFSASDDEGVTWHVIEAGANPVGPTSTTQAITPLDARGSTWLRLVAQDAGQTTRGAVERSSDGGVTWSAVSRELPVGGDRFLSAQLVTDATHSGRVCASLTMLDGANVSTPPTATPFSTAAPTSPASQSGSAIISVPPPQPKDVSLWASDDAGATWHGGVVAALRRGYGGAIPSSVGMSADGACYLATSQTGSPILLGSGAVASFWRLAPGATQPTSEWTITSRLLLSVSVQPDGNGGARVIALSRISGPGDGQPMSCGAGCTTTRDGGVYRLIWQPAPRS